MIGRKRERELLLDAFSSRDSEFVAVYGRRRIGKTFLIRETFDGAFAFQHTGVKKGTSAIQRACFRQSLVEYGYSQCPDLKNWFDAFDNLKTIIRNSGADRKVVFIDEVPWMGRSDAHFISALEHFWNGWASARKDVLLIVDLADKALLKAGIFDDRDRYVRLKGKKRAVCIGEGDHAVRNEKVAVADIEIIRLEAAHFEALEAVLFKQSAHLEHRAFLGPEGLQRKDIHENLSR